MTLRAVLFNIHLYGGLTVGLVLVMLGITGTLLVFRHELEGATEPHLFRVTPAETRVPFDTVSSKIQSAFPGAAIQAVRMPRSSDETYQVVIAKPERQLFVNPYSGDILGVRAPKSGWLDVVFDLHAHLTASDPEAGERIVGIVGIVLLVISLSGIYLWWPGLGKIRVSLSIRRNRGSRRLYFDLHRTSGAIASLFLLMMASTGVAMVFDKQMAPVFNMVTRSSPLRSPPKVAKSSRGPMISISRALVVADSALPGGMPTSVNAPRRAGAPFAVRMKMPSEPHPNGRSVVYLDPSTGRVLRVDDARLSPLGTRIATLMYPIHTGVVGGWVSRIATLLAGISLPILMTSGVVVWWMRTRKKRASIERESARAA